ncbi:MAG: TetR/AcrR family transcriptional regulator [Bacteroidetes bacterium]|nr:TetR/AcrR family transcriptional regulator [Bacteroidota bacterium]
MKLRDENKINRIYKATLTLVKQNGLAGTTMQAVAKEAKIATGTLYIYFENKESLVISLFNECIKESAAVVFKDYEMSAPFKVGFRTIWLNVLKHKVSHFDQTIFLEQCFHSPFIDDNTRAEAKKLLLPLRELLERGKMEELIKDIDTFWLVSFMIGYANEIAKRITYHKKKLTMETLDINFQICWDGIKA